jgi:hypothetical protein
MADLHVLEDLGQRQGRGAGEPQRAKLRAREQDATEQGKPALKADDAVDVGGVAVA